MLSRSKRERSDRERERRELIRKSNDFFSPFSFSFPSPRFEVVIVVLAPRNHSPLVILGFCGPPSTIRSKFFPMFAEEFDKATFLWARGWSPRRSGPFSKIAGRINATFDMHQWQQTLTYISHRKSRSHVYEVTGCARDSSTRCFPTVWHVASVYHTHG